MVKEIIEVGKTVEIAIESACEKLGLERSDVQFDIIDLPKKGFLGLKNTPAKVRVYVEGAEEPTAKTTVPQGAADNDFAENYLRDVLNAMGARDFTIEKTMQEENINLTLKGDGLGFIIGRRGETLDALQYLTGLSVNRLQGEYQRVTIDSGNFREKREKTLESLAKRLARNAVKIGKSTTLEPMNPYERRIIHAAVSTVEGATSTSTGDEPNRRVVISSKNPVRREFKPRQGGGGSRPPYNRDQNRGPRPGGNKPYNRDNRDFKRRDDAPRTPTEPTTVRPAPPTEATGKPLYGKIEIDND